MTTPSHFITPDEAVVLGELNALKKTSPLIGQILFARPDGQTIRADGAVAAYKACLA